LRDQRTVNGVDVGDTSYAFIVPNVTERAAKDDRRVLLSTEDERREHDVYFARHASVGVWQCSRFGKGNDLAVKARQI
jgi:hypothetical protein